MYTTVHDRQTFVGQFGRRNTHLLLKMVGESMERRQRIVSHGGFSNQPLAEVAHMNQIEAIHGLHGQITGSTIIASCGGQARYWDGARVTREYGGDPADRVKNTSSLRFMPDGTRFATHWVEKLKTGKRVGFKPIVEVGE